MSQRPANLGGVIHTYLAYDPKSFPPPTQPPPDMVSGAFDHLLTYGSTRRLTDEELARAIRLDPSQIKGLGPSLEALIEMLEARKRKILATYETDTVQAQASRDYLGLAAQMHPPRGVEDSFRHEVINEQIRGLERMWYRLEDGQSLFARQLVHLIDHLGDKYQVDELAAKYEFSGREPMDIPEAIEIKEELETIDRLLEQLREAMKNAQIAIIDMEALSEFAEPGDMEQLRALQQQVEDYMREMAEQQGLEFTADGYRLTPKAFRIFQSSLLEQIFSDLEAARSGRHSGPVLGEGATELPRTKQYEFGDSPAHMDVPQSLINAMVRRGTEASRDQGVKGEIRVRSDDIEIFHTRNTPKCASVVILDMSGSMRYDGQYVNAKRMALALDGLIRSEYPGDFLQFVEMYSFARTRHISEIPRLMPKPVSIYDSVVRLRADMSDPRITEFDVPLHFTNIQRSLQLARQLLGGQDTPNRQVILLTDGLPTAHFEGEQLFMLYPPDPRTEEWTMRESQHCVREGITLNFFLLPNWSQSEDDIQFAHRMAEGTGGRVFFTGGDELDRFVVWDYVTQRRRIIG